MKKEEKKSKEHHKYLFVNHKEDIGHSDTKKRSTTSEIKTREIENGEHAKNRYSKESGAIRRKCMVCGEPIVGRTDKKFCGPECRSYYNNRRRAEEGVDSRVQRCVKKIYSNVALLSKRNNCILLRIVAMVSTVCKILSNFQPSRKQRQHDK